MTASLWERDYSYWRCINHLISSDLNQAFDSVPPGDGWSPIQNERQGHKTRLSPDPLTVNSRPPAVRTSPHILRAVTARSLTAMSNAINKFMRNMASLARSRISSLIVIERSLRNDLPLVCHPRPRVSRNPSIPGGDWEEGVLPPFRDALHYGNGCLLLSSSSVACNYIPARDLGAICSDKDRQK